MTPESLLAAVELHRPVGFDKWGRKASESGYEPDRFRCPECGMSVKVEGCRTWQTANNENGA